MRVMQARKIPQDDSLLRVLDWTQFALPLFGVAALVIYVLL